MSVVTGALGSLATKLLQLLHDEYKLQKGVRKQVQWLHSELESIHAFLCKVKNIDPRLKAMYKEVTQLIGIDKSREDVISLLNSSHTENDVLNKITKKVSIVGIGGLGKTTLAKAVYDKLSSKYECRAFVSVGRDRDLATVLEDILFRLDKYKYHDIHTTGRGVDLLISEIREFLETKRYFIVVDDVWDVETCKTINLALIENCCGSNVITTTHKFDVAEKAGEVYKLKPISYENSKKLFYTRTFGADGQYLDYKPDVVSDKILKRCAGIPLAIITVTSLLAGKPKDEWSEVYSSIGFRHNDNTDVEDTMTILSFSYYDMPSHLQTCLLYLSTYPEDSYISKDELIWKWIAEGFVDEKQERLFDVGERYFNDLVNRSMIQAVGGQSDGRVSGCRVHDIVLDLLRKFSFKENFIAILHGNTEAISPPSNVRRFALHNRTAEHVSSKDKVIQMQKVRSYTAFGCDINNNCVHFHSFRLLRVLDITGCSFKEGCHLEHLGDLLHLRYLGIKCVGSIPKLSKRITNLKLLQTLVVYGNFPVNIILPTQLLCLHAAGSVPDGIGKLTSLEQLRITGVDTKMFVKELGSLRELRDLEIYIRCDMDKSTQRDFVVSLSNLQNIQKIDFKGDRFCADTAMWEAARFGLPRSLQHLNLDIRLSKVPSCINPSHLPNLSCLILRVTTMDEQDMKHLATLPALSCLSLLITFLAASNINAGGDGCFLKLRYFEINAMVLIQQHNKEDSSISLHIWNTDGAVPFGSRESNCSKNVPFAVMPNLEVLHFEVPLLALMDNNCDCGNIGLEYLPSLQVLRGRLDCRGVSAMEGDDALAALRNACKVHPNHPTFDMSKTYQLE